MDHFLIDNDVLSLSCKSKSVMNLVIGLVCRDSPDDLIFRSAIIHDLPVVRIVIVCICQHDAISPQLRAPDRLHLLVDELGQYVALGLLQILLEFGSFKFLSFLIIVLLRIKCEL